MPKKIERFFTAAILFLNGWNWALPLTIGNIVVPTVFTRVQIVRGVYTHEVLFIIYLCILIERRRNLPIRNHGAGNKIARLIIGLGFLGLFSNAINFQPLREMGEVGRLFLLAIYFLMSIYWAKRHGPSFVLMSLLVGITCAGVINLYYSYTLTSRLGGLPLLLGSKIPGGSMAFMVILTAWLMMEQKRLLNSSILLMLAGIGVFGASICFSKVVMLIAGLGLIAWGFVLFGNLYKRHSRRPTIVMLFVFLAFTGYFSVKVSQYIKGVNVFIDYKFVHINELSVRGRGAYFPATMEIVLSRPLFGVGYAGFYDAITKTETYNNNKWSVPENEASGKRGVSNPHNAFLYYASANGLPGLLLSIVLFISLFRALWRHFSVHGFTGRVVWVCMVISYFLFGMTVPSLFITSLLYVPAAVAIAYDHQYRSTPHLTNRPKQYMPLVYNTEKRARYEIDC